MTNPTPKPSLADALRALVAAHGKMSELASKNQLSTLEYIQTEAKFRCLAHAVIGEHGAALAEMAEDLAACRKALEQIAAAKPTDDEKREEDEHPNNFYAGVQRGRELTAKIASEALKRFEGKGESND